MRVMAVDYGDARTGIAVSDETAVLVGDAWVIREKNQVAAARLIADEALTRGVNVIVVGYPKNMNGTIGPRAKKSDQFAQCIRDLCDIDVMMWDERMTTISAGRILSDTGRHGQKRKKIIDAVAASIILESYLALHSKTSTD